MPSSVSFTLMQTEEGRRAARLLEWARLLDLVAAHCTLQRAADRVRDLQPISDREQLRREWLWVEEIRRHLDRGQEFPIPASADLIELIGDERTERGPLGGEELAAVAGAARGLAELLRGVSAHVEVLPLTSKHLRDAQDPLPLAQRFEAALEPSGRLKDGASPRLGALRRAAAAAESSLREIARREFSRVHSAGWTTENELVLRGDRLCIPVRSGSKSRVHGIVHDRSGSGGTLFIEPMAVVEAGNEASEARMAVEEEERRILVELNRELARHAPGLLDLFERAVVLDARRSRVRWGRAHHGLAPKLLERGGTLQLEGFRHPLLQESLECAGRGDELVPLDLRLDDDRVLVISGPNAGGKTVALKSLGLAALMAQAGIPLPCAHPPTLGLHDHVLIDLGDEQSIADALSSFSAHLSHLKRILDLCTADSLVLLDEIGGGTDPQEAVALARAALEHLAAVGGRCLVTTHYGQLKALVEEDDRFRHASMGFDAEKLAPRFELVLDMPGASHALAIAGRMGLPGALLERARELVGDERLELDELLRTLEEARGDARRLRDELLESRDQARLSQQHYDRLARELKDARRERVKEAEREAEGIIRNARRRVERLLQKIRDAGGDESAVDAAREARQEIDERVERLAQRNQPRSEPREDARPARLEVGAHARHRQLGQVGRIVEVRGDRITLEIGATRVQARPDQLVAPDAEEAELLARPVQGSIRTQLVDASPLAASQVDVRGRDAEEAWALVDRALDRCLVTGTPELEVIHGKGTGRLRRVLSERLSTDPRVKEARIGAGGRYDDGMTQVRL